MPKYALGWGLAVFAVAVALAALAYVTLFGTLAAVLAIGIFFVGYGVHLAMQARRTYEWVQTEGQVRAVRTMREYDDTRDAPGWRVAVEYAYRYAGREFVGRRARFSSWDEKFTDESEAAALAARYPGGSNVIVHVNPRSAEAAVLEPGISSRVASHYYGVIGSGVLISVASLLIMWMLWRIQP